MMNRSIRLKSITGIIFSLFTLYSVGQDVSNQTYKFGNTLGLIDAYYVDSVKLASLTEKAIIEVLKNLDPHSTYVTAKDVREMNEPLLGNFEGIGIQFNILHDTIIVIEPIAGGPSEKVGLRSGDRIMFINKEKVHGIAISTAGVRNRLMGAKGTRVDISVWRKGEKDLQDFSIIRDKIPIYSVDASYMLNKETGYIKLNRFSATTDREFSEAIAKLRKTNMKNLVLDLRGNGGGYMYAATSLANKFFPDQKLLVYLQGRKTPRQDSFSFGDGSLSDTKVVVLIDEGSASASEILSGALQDWDRAVIIGRRSFGKGLVQNQFFLKDSSMIRLTVARYYTPSGRSIQSPYQDGYEKYMENFYKRYSDGEMLSADSVHFPDSLKYKTLLNKRTVYGGGGIMPDLFVAIDTSYTSPYFRKLAGKNVLNMFALEYCDRNRAVITGKYKNFGEFKTKFEFSEDEIKSFIAKGEAEGIPFDEKQFNVSKAEMFLIVKGLIASNIWQINEYFQVINQNDVVIDKALNVLSDTKAYNSLLGRK
jgi:carboxyl-terminal processing protease